MTVVASNAIASPLNAGALPTRAMIIPAPDPALRVLGRDGRSWRLNRNAVLAQLATLNRPVQLDINHSAVLRAHNGEPSPAAAWLSGFQFDASGALWADVAWTPYGREVAPGYKFLSPAFLDQGGEVIGLHSVGLTNAPNLSMPALNAAESGTSPGAQPSQPALNADQLKILRQLGVKPEDLPPPAAAGPVSEAERIERMMGLHKG